MPKKQLQQVAEDVVVGAIVRLNSRVAVAESKSVPLRIESAHLNEPFGGMGLKEVWGVKEAKTKLPRLLREVSAGEIHFVTAGDGTAIVMMSAKKLADAVATIEEQRGMTFADAIGQLPYPSEDLQPVKLRRRSPTRGLLRRARAAVEA